MTTFSTRDRRRKTTCRRPFAAGLLEPERPLANTPCVLAVFAIVAQPGKCVAILEDEHWHERDDPARFYRYGVALMDGETEVEYHGCDTLGDATALARHLSTPLPVEIPCHTAEDERWWSINAPATFQGVLPALSGGAPEPEPVCGLSGAWSMPGEDNWPLDEDCDLEPVERELSDDWNGAFSGHDA